MIFFVSNIVLFNSKRYILYFLCLDVYRKLEQDHKEKLAAVRSELMNEMDQIQQQAGLQREELEAEIEKIRQDESFLRDHLSISVKVPKRVVVITFGEVQNCFY